MGRRSGRGARARGLAVLFLAAAGCPGRAPDLGPRPEVVEPAFGDPGGPTAVTIRGQFRVKAAQALSAPSGNAVDASYRAWLDGTPLGQVRWLDERTLAALVPAGLAPGPHGLEVLDPSGRRGALPGAFFAGVPTVSLAQAVSLSRATLSVGQAATVSVAVSNGGNSPARGVLPVLSLGGPGALAAAAVPPPRDVAPGATEAFAFGFTAAAPGAVPVGVATSAPSPAGGTTSAPPWSGAVLVQAPAVLAASLSAAPSAANLGQSLTLTLTVQNSGGADAAGVAPGAPVVGGTGAALLQDGPTPPSLTVPGGQSRTFQWTFAAQGAGTVTFDSGASGADANSGAALAAGTATSGPVQLLRPASLSAGLVAPPAAVSVGQPFSLSLDVANSGDGAAQGLVPALDAVAGTGACAPAGPALPASAVGAGGSTVRFTRSFTAAAPGTVTLQGSAAGVDATDGRAVSASASAPLLVQAPAALAATLAIPPAFAPGDFTVTLTVTNSGQAAALGVLPGAVAVAPGGGASALEKTPFGGAQDIPGGEARSFAATWTASGTGLLRLEGSAAGSDANSGAAVPTGTATSNAATVGIPAAVELLSVDPFSDGTRFLQVNGWRGSVLVGPNGQARSLALLGPGGGTPALRGLALPRDTDRTGSTSRNSWAGAPPYPSLGSASCAFGNNSACGPDDENAQGLFATATVAGAEWMVAGPVRLFGGARYAYLSADDAAPVPFRYGDLTRELDAGTMGVTAALPSGGVLYLGFGGTTATLVAVKDLDVGGGVDAVPAGNGESLDFALMPGVGGGGGFGPPRALVDALASVAGHLYAANRGGMVRATTADPRPYGQRPSDWAPCTPAAPAWGAKASIADVYAGGLEPRGRAVPAFAAWQGRLFAIRNTADGPQLWACAPAASGDPAHCDPGDWSLAAPNLTGDAQLSQMNDAGNTRATMLAATAAWLYLGFDGAAGVQIYRTSTAAPVGAADFHGLGGCTAGAAGCQGLGGNGLGDPARNTRIQDARALSPAGAAGLYFTTGNGIDPARLHRILD